MKTIIQGKNLKTTYGVDYKWKTIKNDKNEDITVYTSKPELKKETIIDNWKTIYEVNEIIEFNQIPKTFSGFNFNMTPTVGTINLSETEEVKINEKIYRADLNAIILHTDKVLNEEEFFKEESEEILRCQLSVFNKMMIESNELLFSYCKLHKLNPADTDVDELFNVVYPDKSYEITEGRLVLNDMYIPSLSITYSHLEGFNPLKCIVK